MTCSSTLSSANSCGFWNVLTMPKAAMVSGLVPEMSRPCHRTLPRTSEPASPANRLSNVVLPDPLGPRMPTISPSSIVKRDRGYCHEAAEAFG